MDPELNQCSLGFHPSKKFQNEFFPTGVLVNVDSIWPIRGEGNTRGELRQESSLSPLLVMPSIEDLSKYKKTSGYP